MYNNCCIIRSSRPLVFCKNGVLTNFAKYLSRLLLRLFFNEVADIQSLTLSKKRFRHRYFLVNSAKFLITLFIKNPLDSCFRINTRSVYCPTTSFCFFQKRCHTYFPAEYFLGLIYRLATRVSSIFQTLSQIPIFNQVEHLWRSPFSKIVNSSKPLSNFTKKASCECSTRF